MIVTESAPAVGYPVENVCSVSGTQGTLTGVTGNINSGPTALMVNSAADLLVGQYISVAGDGVGGAALDTVIEAINLTTKVVTVADAASTTVSGATVSFRPAVFKGWGTLAP